MNKVCDRCGTEIKLTEDMPKTPRIIYFSGNAEASEVIINMCPTCRKGFIKWFNYNRYSHEED